MNIYKGEVLAIEAECIQEAARWLQQDTGDRYKRFSAITNGIWYYKPYSYTGNTYYFETNPVAVAQYFERTNQKILAQLISDENSNQVN